MKVRIAPLGGYGAMLLALAAFGGRVGADQPVPPPPPPAATAARAPAVVPMSPLDQLTAPIALYPDPLLALLLPAATFPSQIAAAAAYLNTGGDPRMIDVQNWNSSVRGMTHYANVLEWMAQNPEWTAALGEAFASDPVSVMKSIQRLRAVARKAGTLVDTPQQDVVDDNGSLDIEPADPDVIYVPVYEPDTVFVCSPYYGFGGPFLTFGPPFPIGPWLSYQFDWHGCRLWHGSWRNWHTARGWGHPIFPGQPGFYHAETARVWNAPHMRTSEGFGAGVHPAYRAVSPRPIQEGRYAPREIRGIHPNWSGPHPEPRMASPGSGAQFPHGASGGGPRVQAPPGSDKHPN